MKLITKLLLPVALIMSPSATYAALDQTGADWVATVGSEFINVGPATENLATVNFLLCILEKSNFADNVNTTYSSMIDENLCMGDNQSPPSFATQTAVTSRTSNDSPYNITSYFQTGEGEQIVAKTTITSSPTAALPRGVVTMTWNSLAGNDSDTATGVGGVLTAEEDGTVSYIELSPKDESNAAAGLATSFIHGTLNSDGTAKLRVQQEDSSGAQVFAFVIDANSVHYDTIPSSSAECKDRSAENMIKTVHGYKLFTAAGLEYELGYPPFSFSYNDAASNSRRGWASSDGVWLEGGESGAQRPTSVVNTSNGKTYAASYANDGSYTLTHAVDGVYVTTPSLEFDTVDVVIDGNSVTGAALWPYRSSDTPPLFGSFSGSGSNLNLQMECLLPGGWLVHDGDSDCASADMWRPTYNLPDTSELVASVSGLKYYTKAIDSDLELGDDVGGACATLDLSTVPEPLGSYTVTDISSTILWSARPTEANGGIAAENVMKVIHGVEQ